MGVALVHLGLVLICSWLSGPRSVFGKTLVTHLPGFHGRLPFELETGYVAVDEVEDTNLFYYFVKSERSPADDPLLLWIAGGPGCSGLSGLAFEIGPFGFDTETFEIGTMPSLIYREDSWTRTSSIIFVDSPAGSGFSYSVGPEENHWVDSNCTNDLHVFIRKWLLDHPEFIANPFYVAGGSNGGKLTPIVAQKVVNGNKAGDVPTVNLKGYLIGNPATGEKRFDYGLKIPWSYGMGLLSFEVYEAIKLSCGGEYLTSQSVECTNRLEAVNEDLKAINMQHILEPKCDFDLQNPRQLGHRNLGELNISHLRSLKIPAIQCRSYRHLSAASWANSDKVREALGVRKGRTGDWSRCRDDIKNHHIPDIPSSLPYQLNITQAGFRVLVFSGDHDMLANLAMTQAWLKSFNYFTIDKWHPWWVDGQVAGYTTTYDNNLVHATVKGAGHTAAEYKPKECRAMFERWMSGQAL